VHEPDELSAGHQLGGYCCARWQGSFAEFPAIRPRLSTRALVSPRLNRRSSSCVLTALVLDSLVGYGCGSCDPFQFSYTCIARDYITARAPRTLKARQVNYLYTN
jgi:hypothetical protein